MYLMSAENNNMLGERPWDQYTEREVMREICWWEPQADLAAAAEYYIRVKSLGEEPDMDEIARLTSAEARHIERYVLSNGIHAVLIRDVSTGALVFRDAEFAGVDGNRGSLCSPEILTGVDLGDGHILQMVTAHTAEQVARVSADPKDSCTSYVKKIRGIGDSITHEMTYDVDPLNHTLRIGYKLTEVVAGAKRWFNIVLNPHVLSDWNPDHSIAFGLMTPTGRPDGLFSMDFDPNGELTMIYYEGKQNSQPIGELAPGIVASFDGPRVSASFQGAELLQPQAHALLSGILGIQFENPLTLDVHRSTQKMFDNIDAQLPIDPKPLLVFKNSTQIVENAPALNG